MKTLLALIFTLFTFNAFANSFYLNCTVESNYKGQAQSRIVSLPLEGEQSAFIDVANYSIEINKTVSEYTFNLTIHKDDYMLFDDVIIPGGAYYYQNEDLAVMTRCYVGNFQ